jgi:MFS family permease
MTQLIVWRAVQGIGAGALVPLAMTIIGDIFTLEERAKMQGLFSGVWGVSSVFGPLVGGFITDQLSWRWVFLINIPVGIAAAAIIGFAPDRAEATRASDHRLRRRGRAHHRRDDAAPRPRRRQRARTSAASGQSRIDGGDRHHVRRGSCASRNARSIRSCRWHCSAIASSASRSSSASSPASPCSPASRSCRLLAQGVFGATATQAGSFLTPLMLSWVTASIVGGRLLIRIGSRGLVLTGLVSMLGGFAALATFSRTTAARR